MANGGRIFLSQLPHAGTDLLFPFLTFLSLPALLAAVLFRLVFRSFIHLPSFSLLSLPIFPC